MDGLMGGASDAERYPEASPGPGTNRMAIAALVFSFLFAPLGAVFALVALHQIDMTRERGRGLAIAALLIVVAQIVLLSVLWSNMSLFGSRG